MRKSGGVSEKQVEELGVEMGPFSGSLTDCMGHWLAPASKMQSFLIL